MSTQTLLCVFGQEYFAFDQNAVSAALANDTDLEELYEGEPVSTPFWVNPDGTFAFYSEGNYGSGGLDDSMNIFDFDPLPWLDVLAQHTTAGLLVLYTHSENGMPSTYYTITPGACVESFGPPKTQFDGPSVLTKHTQHHAVMMQSIVQNMQAIAPGVTSINIGGMHIPIPQAPSTPPAPPASGGVAATGYGLPRPPSGGNPNPGVHVPQVPSGGNPNPGVHIPRPPSGGNFPPAPAPTPGAGFGVPPGAGPAPGTAPMPPNTPPRVRFLRPRPAAVGVMHERLARLYWDDTPAAKLEDFILAHNDRMIDALAEKKYFAAAFLLGLIKS